MNLILSPPLILSCLVLPPSRLALSRVRVRVIRVRVRVRVTCLRVRGLVELGC